MTSATLVEKKEKTTPDTTTKSGHTARGTQATSRKVVIPEYQIFTKDNGFEIRAALPGVLQENLEVQLEDQWLSIKARANDLGWQGFEELYAEFSNTDFECGFKVPNGIQAEGIKATLKDGMLTVVLPKNKEHARRSISVNAS